MRTCSGCVLDYVWKKKVSNVLHRKFFGPKMERFDKHPGMNEERGFVPDPAYVDKNFIQSRLGYYAGLSSEDHWNGYSIQEKLQV